MSMLLFWFAIELISWVALWRLQPTHHMLVGWIIGTIVFFQLVAIGSALGRHFRLSREVSGLIREAEDAMAEAMRKDDDLTLLPRPQALQDLGLLHKKTRDMTPDELLDYHRILQGRLKDVSP